jgi:hypothetical protein
MSEIGHNQPPSMAITAGEVAKNLSDWMAENPTIETEEIARTAKTWVDRAFLCLKDLDDERIGQVRPLNEQVKTINASYRGPCDLLSGVMHELKSRLDKFILAEEAKRRALAAEAARLAQLAEAAARAAELAEQDALAEADSGVLGVDTAGAIDGANQAFSDYERAVRQAQLAKREEKVKIGGGFRRATAARDTEVLTIEDAPTLLMVLGVTEDIEAAFLKSARAYKRYHGKYPKGIIVTTIRGI